MSDIFQQHFSNCKVAIATFNDNILAGITSLFNYSLDCDFHEDMAHFPNINDVSK